MRQCWALCLPESSLRSFLRHLCDLYQIVAAASRAAEAAEIRAQNACRRLEEAVLAVQGSHPQLVLCDNFHRERNLFVAESEASANAHLRIQLETLQVAVEKGQQRLIDASSFWERKLGEDREQHLEQLKAYHDECALLQRRLADERLTRDEEACIANDMATRLEAYKQAISQLRLDSETVELQAAGSRRAAEFMLGQTEEYMRRTLALWQQGREAEVSELKRQLEDFRKNGAAMAPAGDKVSVKEAHRAMTLVASLWHAAGRKEPVDSASWVHGRHGEDVMQAWKVYFDRDFLSEPPLLRPTSELILSPLRRVVGCNAAEAALAQVPSATVAVQVSPSLALGLHTREQAALPL